MLIENVLATFEMEEILYELREHSAGLNCGIWDYSASFVNKFGEHPCQLSNVIMMDCIHYILHTKDTFCSDVKGSFAVLRSCVSPPGHRQAFLLPDRSKYVNMEKRFLRSYMELLVQTCHRRGALATGGMAALLLPQDPHGDAHRRVLATVTRQEHHSTDKHTTTGRLQNVELTPTL